MPVNDAGHSSGYLLTMLRCFCTHLQYQQRGCWLLAGGGVAVSCGSNTSHVLSLNIEVKGQQQTGCCPSMKAAIRPLCACDRPFILRLALTQQKLEWPPD